MLKNFFLYALLAFTLFNNSSIFCANVRIMSGGDAAFKMLLQSSTKFAKTASDVQTGPNIEGLAKPGRKFIAKMDSCGLDRFFTFETNEDADHIQSAVYNGGGWGVEWYYVDPSNLSQTAKKSYQVATSARRLKLSCCSAVAVGAGLCALASLWYTRYYSGK